jgi:ribose transport system ATP-binding protein
MASPAASPASGRAVRIRGVSKAFAGTQALCDVGMEISPGEIRALVGSNGSGKSTLIKILAGVHTADAGELETATGTYDLRSFSPATAWECRLHFVHQERATFAELSVADNLAMGCGFATGRFGRIRGRALRARTRDVLRRFDIEADPDAPFHTLRPAAQTMVAIARALQDQEEEDADRGILVLDEPTAALPRPEVEILVAALRRYAAAGQAIIFVSHRLEEVFELADRATVLRDGRHVADVDLAEVDHDALVELIVGRPVESYFPDHRTRGDGRPIVEARHLRGGTVRDASLSVHEGEIVGVTGLVGSGCSTLLRLLFGAEPLDGGTIHLGGDPVRLSSPAAAMRAGIAYVPEDRAGQALFPDQSVAENLSAATVTDYWRGGYLRRGAERADVKLAVERFAIRGGAPHLPASHLSGGNQQKLMLARWLRREPRLLLLDEPTQGVDVGARADLWSTIRRAVENGAGALVASSDTEELAHMCDRVAIVHEGRVTGQVEKEQLSSDRLVELVHTARVTR